MENLDLVKIVQESPPSSVESGIRNTHNTGCNLNTNRSSPLSNPNGVSSFSGKTSPSVIPGSVEVLASFMQDIQKTGRTDSEILQNCETRWLQLFKLVEKQCQEQIVAQQEQFHHQIQLVQNEIWQLLKLQNSNVSWDSSNCRSSPAKFTNNFSSLESQMGLRSETLQENEPIVNQLKSNEAESQPKASAVHQECFANTISMNSAYGTLTASELNPSKSMDIKKCMEYTETISKGQGDALVTQGDVVVASIQTKRECAQKTEDSCPSLKDDILVFPAEFEHKFNEDQCGKTNCKSLTSWAQKLKQSQSKKTNVEEEGHVNSMQQNEQGKKLTFETINLTDAASPSYAFYLSQPNESPSSLTSEASGLTYWKLDEKELYHPLPENFRNEFSNIFSTKLSSDQLSSGEEMKPSSLKDIYHKKQRENKQLPEWNRISPSQPSHPPEVLTLDPTLHMRPGQHNPGHCFFSTSEEKTPFSPDSMADPTFSSHSDTDSFSHASNITSPQLEGSPKYPSSAKAIHLDPWKNHGFQNETKTTCSFPMAYTDAGNILINTEDEESLTLTPSSITQSQFPCAASSLPEYSVSVASFEDPVVLSKIRQNLREKHARHIADLRAYYDSEIHSLKQQLEASHKTASSEDLKKINQNLVDRCDQLDAALNEASARMRALENKNNMLEKQVTDWRERFYAASNTSKVLQERIEEMRTSNKDKDNTISRLKSRLKDLEEAFEKAYKLSDNKDTRLKEENKMFQDLLGEYESLGKEHERVKDTLNATENRLLDANTQISDLKRTISKLEVQLKQVEHENMLKFRHITESHLRTSHVNSKLATPDVSRRKWLIPGAEYSIFTGQPLESQETKDNRLEETYIPSRHHSPPEKDSSQEDSSANVIGKKENEAPETPIMKAFKELEERKAFKDWTTQTEKDNTSAKTSNRRQTVGFDETTFITSRSPEKCKDQQRPKRYSSPSGQRSSSLPPSNRKSNTPTRREIMLAPVSVTYSPKRSPKENLSPGFSHLLSKNENTVTRFDILLDDLDLAPASTPQHSNPRKRLQFLSLDDIEGRQHSGKGINSCVNYNSCAESLHPGTKKGTVESAWEERNITHKNEQCVPVPVAPYEADFKYTARIKTLAETERLFDELTQEKQQIEAALSRIPCAGGRMTLQTRLNQEALENRLERINRDLGSIRMTLKRFHVLRTSANI
ncbi:M-phase phosphoprotein 9 isoform X2 [Alligator mississippiensis]|uniref:M-phase phosphoprotein 9 isoform A n=1 Tax=Alligator mississippiensis TaxID=8496 RepID=A0A151NRZ3_ALLMI|nr:M-phase phosphoprotein 9 isoform X2 [Alligator mississippiensis]KYO39631.1 M-phase phosphoprotein 9 isoform A [Alligator mississippiensis]